MKCKWRKAVLISISVFCVLIAVYVFVLPPFVQKQLNDLGNIEIEYNGSVQSITNADEISDVLDHMKMSEWERTFDSISDIAGRYSFTESKVKNMLYHSRNRLREYLKKAGVEV